VAAGEAVKYQGLLHVYGPQFWHDNVYIVGNEDALGALRDALTAVIDSGRGACLSFASDGEGFAAVVLKADQEQIDKLAMPYSDEVAREAGRGEWPDSLITADEYTALIKGAAALEEEGP
jgi:hypothetical protein